VLVHLFVCVINFVKYEEVKAIDEREEKRFLERKRKVKEVEMERW
jgi:hypothetical protein